MDLATLTARFAIPGILSFDQQADLIRINISTPHAQARMFLQGAHLVHWRPAGEEPVLLLSRKSEFAPGRPIRGGIPIAFPWFAADSNPNRIHGKPGPAHGFARLQDWTLVSVTRTGKNLGLKLTLGPTAMSRSMGYDAFLLTLDALIGAELETRLTVANTGTEPLHFEEAFHSYYNITDIHEVAIDGLEPTPYVDKVDDFKVKPAAGVPIRFTGPADRVYLNTVAPITIHSGTQRRDLHLLKSNSHTTVVWNPWKGGPDLGEWDWHEMVCVETVNSAVNARTLPAGESFTMGAKVSVKRWAQ
jgi:glucose-6-phosphate 1-epimerase